MRHAIPLIVFSDLDGTLLDHDSYSWEPARPALTRLSVLGVPVILATSKTEAEVTALQEDMGLSAYPAIVENGAGLTGFAPTGDGGRHTYDQLRKVLASLPHSLREAFNGFGDISTQEVAQLTGLSHGDAQRAKTRAFSEPGQWTGSDQARAAFVAELAQHGVTARAGGRFLTLSFGKTKQDRMAEVMAHFGALRSIALGDAPNDAEMLEAADRGVIIANPHAPPLRPLQGEETGRITRTEHPGPSGWNTAILAHLDAQDLTEKDYNVG